MFTGIIEECGTIRSAVRTGQSMRLAIACKTVLEDIRQGDSIAVNGICLTATTFSADGFTADVMPETFRRTALRQLHTGSTVNLERAMRADSRFGGHVVSGHIDGTGTIQSVEEFGNAFLFRIRASAELIDGMVEKGSVAIDGISLTIASVEEPGKAQPDGSFSVSVIPHTRSHTTLAEKRRGSTVNIECDMLGKYVKKYLEKH